MMDMTPAGEAILKTDTLGRVQTPKERREQLLDEFEKSGLTGQKFAGVSGVKYQTFATWAQRRRRAREAKAAKAPVEARDPVRWLEAVVEESSRDKRPLVFIGHPEAGQRSAIIYSILGSCRRHRINPADYLRHVFDRLPNAKTSELKSLTPAAWAKTHTLSKPRPS